MSNVNGPQTINHPKRISPAGMRATAIGIPRSFATVRPVYDVSKSAPSTQLGGAVEINKSVTENSLTRLEESVSRLGDRMAVLDSRQQPVFRIRDSIAHQKEAVETEEGCPVSLAIDQQTIRVGYQVTALENMLGKLAI